MGGNKKALVIGINYPTSKNALQGCGPDAKHFRDLLSNNGFSTTLLCDSQKDFPGMDLTPPTRDNIINSLKNMVAQSGAGDTIVVTYSGHGTQIPAAPGSGELDGETECLVPSDALSNPYKMRDLLIKDYELKEIIQSLAPGASFVGIMDGCHTGSIFNFNENLDEQRDLPKSYACISGCQDRQTSADAWLDGIHQGALSASILAWVKTNGFDNMISNLLNESVDAKRSLQKDLISWLQGKNMEQRPNISFEIPGVHVASLPATKPNPVPTPPRPTNISPTQVATQPATTTYNNATTNTYQAYPTQTYTSSNNYYNQQQSYNNYSGYGHYYQSGYAPYSSSAYYGNNGGYMNRPPMYYSSIASNYNQQYYSSLSPRAVNPVRTIQPLPAVSSTGLSFFTNRQIPLSPTIQAQQVYRN